jgi:hypothetical protein
LQTAKVSSEIKLDRQPSGLEVQVFEIDLKALKAAGIQRDPLFQIAVSPSGTDQHEEALIPRYSLFQHKEAAALCVWLQVRGCGRILSDSTFLLNDGQPTVLSCNDSTSLEIGGGTPMAASTLTVTSTADEQDQVRISLQGRSRQTGASAGAHKWNLTTVLSSETSLVLCRPLSCERGKLLLEVLTPAMAAQPRKPEILTVSGEGVVITDPCDPSCRSTTSTGATCTSPRPADCTKGGTDCCALPTAEPWLPVSGWKSADSESCPAPKLPRLLKRHKPDSLELKMRHLDKAASHLEAAGLHEVARKTRERLRDCRLLRLKLEELKQLAQEIDHLRYLTCERNDSLVIDVAVVEFPRSANWKGASTKNSTYTETSACALESESSCASSHSDACCHTTDAECDTVACTGSSCEQSVCSKSSCSKSACTKSACNTSASNECPCVESACAESACVESFTQGKCAGFSRVDSSGTLARTIKALYGSGYVELHSHPTLLTTAGGCTKFWVSSVDSTTHPSACRQVEPKLSVAEFQAEIRPQLLSDDVIRLETKTCLTNSCLAQYSDSTDCAESNHSGDAVSTCEHSKPNEASCRFAEDSSEIEIHQTLQLRLGQTGIVGGTTPSGNDVILLLTPRLLDSQEGSHESVDRNCQARRLILSAPE